MVRSVSRAALLTALLWTGAAWGLTPDQVAVIFNTRSSGSLRIARYYAAARKIPQDHLIGVTCPPGELITEEMYRDGLVPQVRKALADQHLDRTVKCLVTTYDVPLKIAAQVPSIAERAVQQQSRQGLDQALAGMEQTIEKLDRLAGSGASATAPATRPGATAPATSDQRSVAAMTQKLAAAADASRLRIEAAPEAGRDSPKAEWGRLVERAVGVEGIMLSYRPTAGEAGNPDLGKRLDALRAQVRDLQQQYASLNAQPDSPAVREQVVTVVRRLGGLVGEARYFQSLIERTAHEQSEACLDNELALVLADQSYERGAWTFNRDDIAGYPSLRRRADLPQPQLLVTRLDGSSVAKVQQMIDTTLAVEARGLDGKIYLDARGIHANDGYGMFDEDLRKAADWLKAHSTIEVVLDERPELLEAKDCPSAALYCGWYSLNAYRDSCQWLPGAVGYHVASYEMPSLHRPKETGWVVNLLDRGFCGTLGATDEPYLTAFPKPSLFFPLLLSGEFTQGEVWELTAPLLSWRIGYVGDPLYNPFRARPRVKVEDLRADRVLRNAFLILREGSAPQPATTHSTAETASQPGR